MPKPITPLVGCDIFILNEQKQVLLIKRSDNGFWALPGGCHDLGESPKECAERECFEETGFKAKATQLLGVFSSHCYEYKNYPWIENEFCHLLFQGEIVSGSAKTSAETTMIDWFFQDRLPPLTDGHDVRIEVGFAFDKKERVLPHFE